MAKLIFLVLIFGSISSISCDISELLPPLKENEAPKTPYAFGYAAGRYPGHIDRTHSEISDGNTVQGSFSYVDPNYKIRTVNYVADEHGFHPNSNFAGAEDTQAVAYAKQKHLQDFNNIAYAHQTGNVPIPGQTQAYLNVAQKHNDLYQKIAEEHARIAAERQSEVATNNYKF
ncbi:uncharacterized protein [Onthophagus taurus]|uniref:uncharacterized protein n=1 Tax=Onthophagus taurus TaxID=166361 RepID=UPI0039BE965C